MKLPPVYVAQQPSAMAAAAMMMYAPAANQQVPQQWQWPPQQHQQQQHQLIYPSGVPQYPQQTLMVPMHDSFSGAGGVSNGNGGVACAYLGHDAAVSNQDMLRG